MKRRRLLITGVLLLLLGGGGAIVNVAVAWGFAMWGSFGPYAESVITHQSQPRWRISLGRGGIGITRVVYVPDNELWPDRGDYTLSHETPYWSVTKNRPTQEVFNDIARPWSIEIGFGWPCRSAHAELRHYISQHPGESHPVGEFYAVTGIEIHGRKSSALIPFHVLPTRPIVPGFAINTIFYAAMLWMMFAMPFVVRRHRRIKRGLCPACAYPVGTSEVCTECGGTVQPRRGDAQTKAARQ